MNAQNVVWCTLVMLNDNYIPGALILAKSLHDVKTKYPIWCMVDEHVSTSGINVLEQIFDKVVKVPTLIQPVAKMKSKKQNEIYGSWIHASFTKFNILNPDLFPVDKIMFLDADMLFIENCDELFELNTPAMTFSSPWARPYVKTKYAIYNPYGEMKHGQTVAKNKIIRGFNKSILGLACMMLVKPNKKTYDIMLRLLRRDNVYGNSDCVSGFDEQLVAETLLATGEPIYHIHQQYNFVIGKYNWLVNGEKPKTLQWYNSKPWDEDPTKEGQWDDVKLWHSIKDKFIEEYPETKKWFYPKLKNNNLPS